MGRLKAAMQDRYKNRDEDVKIHTPRNLESLELTFRGERVAKVDSLAMSALVAFHILNCVRVTGDWYSRR